MNTNTNLFDIDVDLQHKLDSVLGFAIENIKMLPQFEGNEDVYSGTVKWSDKILAETLLLLLLLKRNRMTADKFAFKIDHLSNLCIPLARCNSNKIEILKSPKLVLPLGFSHIMLNNLGYPDSDFDFIIQSAIASGKINNVERISFREMDLHWGLFMFNEKNTLSFENILEFSILKKNVSVYDMTREDEYAFTHSIFYTTDFGRCILPASIDKTKINNIIDGCIAKNVLVEDLDLLGEFLICSIIVNNTHSHYFNIGLQYLLNAWNDLGFLPSPGFNKQEFLNLSGPEAKKYIYKNIYHTFYVGGILCHFLLSGNNPFKNQNGSSHFLPDCSSAELITKLESLSIKAHKFCNESFKTERLRSLNEKINNDSYQKSVQEIKKNHFKRHKHLSELESYLASENPGYESFVLDCLLLENLKKHNIPVLCDLVTDIIKCRAEVTFIFLETLHYLTRQELSSGSMSGFFFINVVATDDTRMLLEVKIANCLRQASVYLKKLNKKSKAAVLSL